MPDARRPGPHVLVVFGATGDLAARKLFPGLFHLMTAGLMPEEFRIIGSGRHSPGTDDEFRDQVREALEAHASRGLDDEAWESFRSRISFQTSSAEDGSELAEAVTGLEDEMGDGEVRRLIYLSVPPSAMEDMVSMLGSSGLADRARVVMEKPFGTDLASARKLNAAVHEVFGEDQVFRIDHFLGKEAAQNLLAARFANGLLEPIWNRDHIAYVQIDVPEELGLEGRGSFYDATGAFKDMVVTHLSQLLGLVALEPPVALDAGGLRDEKAKVFRALRPLDPEQAVFGQFEGYEDEPDVEAGSGRETFVALRAEVDTWRWHGVPFLLRTGKRLKHKGSAITIGFKAPPLRMFALHDGSAPSATNELCFELTDRPNVTVDLLGKAPGPRLELVPATLTLELGEAGSDLGELEAYERLLHDVMLGDHLLFTRGDEIEHLWEKSQPLLDDPPRSRRYAKGSWGPEAADAVGGEAGWRLSR